ncbi:hypothetical protein ACFX10_004790 [Malus domestica]
MCITLRAACSNRAAHSRGPTCSHSPSCSRRAACSRGPACSRRAAYSHGPACSSQPAPAEQPTLAAQLALEAQPVHASQSAPMTFQAAQVGPRLSQPSRPTIEPGAFSPYFFREFDISQLKSRARSLPLFHCLRMHIPSNLFQPKWRTTLVSTSHRVDKRLRTADDLGESALAAHRDATCPRRGVPK